MQARRIGTTFRRRLTFSNVVSVVALFAALGGGALAASSIIGADGTINGCFASKGKKAGSLRVVKRGQRCKRGERAISWSQKGQAGERGMAGQSGQTGPAGSDAQFNGAAAAGDLAGTYPAPTLAAGLRARIPSQTQTDALVGSSGTPSLANPFVTSLDGRLTNARAPTGNAGGDLNGSTYPNPQLAGGVVGDAETANRTRSILIPASEIAGAALAPEGPGGDPDIGFSGNAPALRFDQLTPEAIDLLTQTPTDRVAGTGMTVQLYWSSTAVGAAFWQLEALSLGVADLVNAAPVVEASGAFNSTPANSLEITPFPISGATPVNGELLLLRISRLASDENDTLAPDAYLHLVEIQYTADR